MSYDAKDQSGVSNESPAASPAVRMTAARIATRAFGKETRGIVGTLVLKGISAITAFAMFSLAARSMSGEDFGHLVTWFSIAQIVCVIGLFGQEMLVMRKLGEYSVTGQQQYVKGVLLFSIAVAAILCTLGSLTVGLFVLTIQKAGIILSLSIIAFMLTNAASMLGSQIARFFVGIFVADGSRQFLWRIALVAVLAISVALDRKLTPSEFLLMASIALAGVAFIQGFASWRCLPAGLVTTKPQHQFRSWLSTSTRFLASSTLEATNQYFDVVVIYWLLDPIAAGGYYAASRLANLFAVVLDALFTYTARHMPPLYFAARREELNRHLVKMAEVLVVCVLIGVGIYIFGAKTLLSVFGSGFVDQQTTLIILALGTAFQALGGPSAILLLTTGHETAYTWTITGNVVLRLMGFLVLVPLFGAAGAAVAASLSLAIATIVLNYLCRQRIQFDPSVLALIPSWRPSPANTVSRSPLVPPLQSS